MKKKLENLNHNQPENCACGSSKTELIYLGAPMCNRCWVEFCNKEERKIKQAIPNQQKVSVPKEGTRLYYDTKKNSWKE